MDVVDLGWSGGGSGGDFGNMVDNLVLVALFARGNLTQPVDRESGAIRDGGGRGSSQETGGSSEVTPKYPTGGSFAP